MDFSAISAELSTQDSLTVANLLIELEKMVYKLGSEYTEELFDNSEVRSHFVTIASSLGVDLFTLKLATQNFRNELLNRVNVVLVEVATSLLSSNGGITPLTELARLVGLKLNARVSPENIEHSVKQLQVLGSNFAISTLQTGTKVLKCTSGELSTDYNCVLGLCEQNKNHVNVNDLAELDWSQAHAQKVLDDMVMWGFLWVDERPLPEYWNPRAIVD